MKIIALKAENIKNLKAIEIQPNGDSVILTGKNGAGKSAILDSIFMALTGKKIEQPIRNGETRAEINVDLGDYKIRRIFTEKTDRLEVMSKDGAVFKSPQTLLNTLFGDLSFDPLVFANMKEKPQRELLAQLVGLDFTALDAKRLNLYNERTIKNREIKGGDTGKYKEDPLAPLPLESLVGQMEIPEPGTPRQEISIAETISKINVIEDKRAQYLKAVEAKKELEQDIKFDEKQIEDFKREYKTKIDDLKARIEQLQLDEAKNIKECIDRIEYTKTTLSQMVIPEETGQEEITKARQALGDTEMQNIKIRKAIEYDKKQAELQAAKKVIAELESDMIKIDIEKDEKIKAAKFPIEGLGITDACVTYNGKPFSQLSTGEQIRVSTAIAMALNPTLRLIIIREGSLLDADGIKTIMEIAEGGDYQLFIEKVADEKGVGIYIEQGEIKV